MKDHWKRLITLLILVIGLINLLQSNVSAQDSVYTETTEFIFPYHSQNPISADAEKALSIALARTPFKPIGDQKWFVLDLAISTDWIRAYVLLASVEGYMEPASDPLNVLVKKTENGWQAITKHDDIWTNWLQIAPEYILSDSWKIHLFQNIERFPNTTDVTTATLYFPWECNETARVSQPAHADYAIDWILDHNNVTASSDGTITFARWASNTQCRYDSIDQRWEYPNNYPNGNQCLWTEANYIMLQDDTGKHQYYLHFSHDTVDSEWRSELPKDVEHGDFLAKQGNTGWTSPFGSGTHLHFGRWNNDGYENVTFQNGISASSIKLNDIHTSQNCNVDNTPPIISCSIPTANQWYKTNQIISCTASDSESGVSHMKWGWNDTSPDNQINGSSLNIDLTSAPQGKNQFYVQAWNGDNVPSGVKSYGWFGYDTQPPLNPTSTISGCEAANNVWQNSCNDPNFSWSGASDGNGSGVKDYHYYWGTNSAGALTTYTEFSDFDPSAVSDPDGVYYLRVATRDQLDQESSPSTLFVLRYDASQPTASVQINNGSATTNQVNVWLDMTSADTGSGVDQVRISNNGTDWTTWQSYQASLSWTIPALDRRDHTVYVQVKDKAGNISATASDEITLDMYPIMPHSANYRICADSFNAAGSADPFSNSYTLVSSIGQAWSGGATGSNLNEQSGFLPDMDNCLPIEHAAGENYQVTNWVVAAGGGLRGSTNYTLGNTTGEAFASEESHFSSANYQLASGFWANVNLGVIGQPPPPTPTPPPITPTPTATPGPTATPVPGGFGVSINNGSLYTNNAQVTVNLSAPNVTHMRLSNDGGYTDDNWVTYQPATNWQITTFGNYVLPRLVYVWFKDAESTIYGIYFDDIIYDPVAPEGSVTVLGTNDNTVDLLLAAEDDNSGVTQMRVSENENFNDTEWQAYEEIISWELNGDTVYAQFRDAANNESLVYSSEINSHNDKVYLPMITRQYQETDYTINI